jgi:hypothetical protein
MKIKRLREQQEQIPFESQESIKEQGVIEDLDNIYDYAAQTWLDVSIETCIADVKDTRFGNAPLLKTYIISIGDLELDIDDLKQLVEESEGYIGSHSQE